MAVTVRFELIFDSCEEASAFIGTAEAEGQHEESFAENYRRRLSGANERDRVLLDDIQRRIRAKRQLTSG